MGQVFAVQDLRPWFVLAENGDTQVSNVTRICRTNHGEEDPRTGYAPEIESVDAVKGLVGLVVYLTVYQGQTRTGRVVGSMRRAVY